MARRDQGGDPENLIERFVGGCGAAEPTSIKPEISGVATAATAAAFYYAWHGITRYDKDAKLAQWAWTEVLAEEPGESQARERLLELARTLKDGAALIQLLREQLTREPRGPAARLARISSGSSRGIFGNGAGGKGP